MLVVVAFSSLARILGEMFDHSFPACAFFFLSGDWLAHINSTVAQRAETTVAGCSLTSFSVQNAHM